MLIQTENKGVTGMIEFKYLQTIKFTTVNNILTSDKRFGNIFF